MLELDTEFVTLLLCKAQKLLTSSDTSLAGQFLWKTDAIAFTNRRSFKLIWWNLKGYGNVINLRWSILHNKLIKMSPEGQNWSWSNKILDICLMGKDTIISCWDTLKQRLKAIHKV